MPWGKPKQSAAHRRRAIADKAKQKYPDLYEKMIHLQERAKEAFASRYTPADLCEDISKELATWSKDETFAENFIAVQKIFEITSRKGTSEYSTILRVICPESVDRKRRSKLGAKVESGVSRRTRSKRFGGTKK